MAREGAIVVATDLHAGPAEETAAQVLAAGGRAEARALDVHDDAAIAQAVAQVVATHGRLDVLHCHAGLQVAGKLEEVSAADMDASWGLNVRAHFLLSQAVLAPMRAQGGGSASSSPRRIPGCSLIAA